MDVASPQKTVASFQVKGRDYCWNERRRAWPGRHRLRRTTDGTRRSNAIIALGRRR
jgi:hypothetical protein